MKPLKKKLNEYTIRELKDLKKWGESELDEWIEFIVTLRKEIERRKNEKKS